MGKRYGPIWLAVFVTGFVTLILLLGRLLVSHSFLLPRWYQELGHPLDPPLLRFLPVVLSLGLFLTGLRILARRPVWLTILWSLLAAVAIPVCLLNLVNDPFAQLLACTVSRNCTGGFATALRLTPAVLRAWPALMPGMRDQAPHIAISAPGWPLLYLGLSRGLAQLPAISKALAGVLRPIQCNQQNLISLPAAQMASAWFGIASPLWSALTVLPLYWLGRDLAGDRVARSAIVWWPLVPALSLFAGSPATVYPLLGTTTVCLVWRGTRSEPSWRSWVYLVLAGGLMGVGLLLNFSLVPLLMLCGVLVLCAVYAVHAAYSRSVGGLARASLKLGAIGCPFLLGLAVVLAAYGRLAGHSLVALLPIAMSIHLATPIPYLPGLYWHAWDFVMMAGLPVCVLAIMYLFGPRSKYISWLAIALGSTMGAVILSGTATTEVGRVWIFFVPFVLLVAAATSLHYTPGQRRLVILAQAAWLVLLASTYTPRTIDLPGVLSSSEMAGPGLAAPMTPTNAEFGDILRLMGYQSAYRPEKHSLAVALHWQALEQIETPYYFSAVLVTPDGRSLPGIHWQPFSDRYPTTCWQPAASGGATIVEQIELPLGTDAAPGNWWLSLSAFSIADNEAQPPLRVVLADGGHDKQLGLGPLTVPAQ